MTNISLNLENFVVNDQLIDFISNNGGLSL